MPSSANPPAPRLVEGSPCPPKRRHVGAAAIAAVLLASPVPAQEAGETSLAQEVDETINVTARIYVEWLSPPTSSVRGGMKTSDVLAIPRTCDAEVENGGFCVTKDGHEHTPKNIGNVLCLPAAVTDFVIEDSCIDLLFEGQNRCQRNAVDNRPETCASGQRAVMPYCNYRTEKIGEVEWSWTITETEGVHMIGCSQKGYRGFTPKDLAEEASSIVTGCLRYGRLTALAAGDQPLRPCGLRATQITMPVAVDG